MATPTLPDIASVPKLPDESSTRILDQLFEPSKNLHIVALPILRSKAFSSYLDLIDAIRRKLLDLHESAGSDSNASATLISILGAHPRLGAKKVDSVQSAAEQAQLKSQDGSQEAELLAKLNAEYEAKFPGLIYVVFVNGRTRNVIMENMKERIARGDALKERVEAIQAMSDIAKDRASKLAHPQVPK